MDKLYFTTTKPYSVILQAVSEEIIVKSDVRTTRKDFPPFTDAKLKGRNTAYIHGEAQDIAGFDIPVILGGNKAQMDRPISEQEIVMVIDDIEYPCYAILNKKGHIDEDRYYLMLVDDAERRLKAIEKEVSQLQADVDAYVGGRKNYNTNEEN